MQDPKNRHLSTITQLCRAVSLQLRHVSTVEKIAKQQYLLLFHMFFGPLTAKMCWRVWGTPANFNGFASWQRYFTALYSSGRQPNFAALNRGRHLYSAGRPSRWALTHILQCIKATSANASVGNQPSKPTLTPTGQSAP